MGRCANYVLGDQMPLRIFNYAEKDVKIKRCNEKTLIDKNLMATIKNPCQLTSYYVTIQLQVRNVASEVGFATDILLVSHKNKRCPCLRCWLEDVLKQGKQDR